MEKIAALMLTCALTVGCAAQRVPADLDLRKAAIVERSTDSIAVSNGASSTAGGAGRGAGVGAGTGLAFGAVGCLASGPLYPLCLAAVIPSAIAIGTVGGATVGAVKSESGASIATKLDMLKTELAETPYQTLLAQQLQTQAQARFGADLPLVDSKQAAGPEWLIDVAVTELVANAGGAERPFNWWMEARLSLRRAGAPRVLYETTQDVTSEASLTTAQWSANGAEALRSGLNQSLRTLAEKMLDDLTKQPRAKP